MGDVSKIELTPEEIISQFEPALKELSKAAKEAANNLPKDNRAVPIKASFDLFRAGTDGPILSNAALHYPDSSHPISQLHPMIDAAEDAAKKVFNIVPRDVVDNALDCINALRRLLPGLDDPRRRGDANGTSGILLIIYNL